MSKNLKTAAAILGAAAAGLAFGILFAPEKGSKTRSKFKKGLDGTAHKLKKSISRKSGALLEKSEQASENLGEAS